jgi:RimJ/RimL family protein N-acetyltransferase
MSAQLSEYLHSSPFVLTTKRLIIVPTPIAIRYSAYIQLYGGLHASEAFCQMAFGPHFMARAWSEEETRNVIVTRDMARCWKPRGLGDFAVALRSRSHGTDVIPGGVGRKLDGAEELEMLDIRDDDDDEAADAPAPRLDLQDLSDVEWVGYAGVRDATTTSMPERVAGDDPLPPWQEMIELRYGVHADFWGKGVAGEAARAVMQWAVGERGVTRFIAETEKTNTRSGQVLKKMGFRESGTDYWKEPSEVEWERVAG